MRTSVREGKWPLPSCEDCGDWRNGTTDWRKWPRWRQQKVLAQLLPAQVRQLSSALQTSRSSHNAEGRVFAMLPCARLHSSKL